MMTEGREVDSDRITQHVVHPALHQDYTSDFQSRRVADIAPTLTSPILAGITSSMRLPERPTMPEEPETPKAQEHPQGGGEALVQPAIPGPSHIDEPMEMEEEKPLGILPINLDATILTNLPEDPADIIVLDDDDPSFTDSYPVGVSTPIIESASDRKRSSEETSSSTSPQKKQATEGTVDPPSPQVSLPKGTTEKDLLPRRHEVFTSDYKWVQRVRAGSSGWRPTICLQRVKSTVPATFIFEQRHLKGSLLRWMQSIGWTFSEWTASWWSALWINSPPRMTGSCCIPMWASSITFRLLCQPFRTRGCQVRYLLHHLSSDKEFLLSNFHRHVCLVRQSFNIEGRCRQLAFCPYCGVINENSDMAISHVRKHLDLQSVCGGCFSKSFLNGPALHRHMRTCALVAAIRDCSKS